MNRVNERTSIKLKKYIQNNYISELISPNVKSIYDKISKVLRKQRKNYFLSFFKKQEDICLDTATTFFIIGKYGCGKEILLEEYKEYYLDRLEKPVLEHLEDTLDFDPHPILILKEDDFPNLDKEYHYPKTKKTKITIKGGINEINNANLKMSAIKSLKNILIKRESKNLATVIMMEGDSDDNFVRFIQESLEHMEFKREFFHITPITEKKFEDLIGAFLRESNLTIKKTGYYNSLEKITFECNYYNINKLILIFIYT